MIQVNYAGEKKTAQAFEVRVGGVETPSKIAQIRVGGVAKTFWQDFAVSASPSHVNGNIATAGSDDAITAATTAIVTGGTAPFTYLWTGGTTDWVIDNDAAATTAFIRLGLGPGDSDTTTFSCTVTDASGAVQVTNTVTAVANNIGTL